MPATNGMIRNENSTTSLDTDTTDTADTASSLFISYMEFCRAQGREESPSLHSIKRIAAATMFGGHRASGVVAVDTEEEAEECHSLLEMSFSM